MKEYWISTYTGKRFDYKELNPEQFDIVDIARALSNIPRYCGQLDRFYSVAEHSVNVCALIEKPEALFWGLMHDAAEAYFGDVPRPFKWLVPQIEEVEVKIQEAIREVWSIPYNEEIKKEVRRCDQILLMGENKQLRKNHIDWGYYEEIPDYKFELIGLQPLMAEKLFLNTFHDVHEHVLQNHE